MVDAWIYYIFEFARTRNGCSKWLLTVQRMEGWKEMKSLFVESLFENPFVIGSPLLYLGVIVGALVLMAIVFGIQASRERRP